VAKKKKKKKRNGTNRQPNIEPSPEGEDPAGRGNTSGEEGGANEKKRI